MKKFTLVLVATLLAVTTGLAQSGQNRIVKPLRTATQMAKDSKQKRPSMSATQKQGIAATAQSLRQTLAPMKAKDGLPKPVWQQRVAKKAATESIITDQPAGDYVVYSVSSDAYYPFWGYVFYTAVNSAVGEVVFGQNNEVYVKNMLTQYKPNAWVKGTISGSTITFEMPQLVMDYYGEPYYITLNKYDEEEGTYVPSDELTALTFDYNAETKAITTPEGSDLQTGDVVIVLGDANGEWAGYADWNMNMTVMTDEPVAAPAGLTTETYSVVADGFDGALAQVGFDGDDIYVQGLYPNLPEAWVKGTISGDKVTFKSGQYLGADTSVGYHQYLTSASVEQLWDDYYEEYYDEYMLTDADIVFDYDASTKSLTNGSTFLINAGLEAVNYAAALKEAKIRPFTEVAATPAAPELYAVYEEGYSYYLNGWGWGYLYFSVPCADEEGNYILPDKLSYAIYTRVNGEEKVLELTADDYVYLDYDRMTEVPFSYSEGWDITASGTTREIYYYVVGPEAFGVQSIYRGAGEERRSEIVWADVYDLGAEVQPDAATPEYPEVDPENVGETIEFGLGTGEEENELFGENKPQTYDVAIRISDPTLEGTHIDAITFPYAINNSTDATDVKVWLSSQLRVEDNVNVPDLVSIDVTPEKAGLVTVKLDKPYTIPEGGVYVGYSMTIPAANKQAQKTPIVTFKGENEDGFYIHTSRGFLKWMPITDLYGTTADIRVSISGSSIKANAAAPQDGEMTYVKTGEAIRQPITFVNHGSNGIKSLDLELALNGQKLQQHIDLDEPVSGNYGYSYTATVELPAIDERGNYPLDVTVTKVNGEENEDIVTEATTELVALNSLPKHRAIIEEYTGTWCGYCPRGFVALEMLAEQYPDEYVRVSYHNGDPMEIMPSDEFPNEVSGFPAAWIERVAEVDPYYGSGDDNFGVAADLAMMNELFGHADLDIKATYDADADAVNVETNVTFPYDLEESPYALEYILVEDGLTGPAGSDWDQSNYYAGEVDSEDLAQFTSGASKVQGLVFNDVAVMMSVIGGIEGSLPATIEADKPMADSYIFDLAEAFNTAGDLLIQDRTKLRVVVLLIDTETGEVVNANKAEVSTETGISTLTDGKSGITSIQYFDLSGRQLPKAQQGVNILRVNYGNGTHKTVKVMKR